MLKAAALASTASPLPCLQGKHSIVHKLSRTVATRGATITPPSSLSLQSRLGKVLDPETLPQRSVEVGRVGRAAAELMASPVCERSTQAENQGEVAAPCGMRDGGAAEAASVQDLKIIGRSCCSGIDDGGKGDASCSDLEGDGDKRAAMHHRGGKKTLLSLQPLAARCCYDGCCQVASVLLACREISSYRCFESRVRSLSATETRAGLLEGSCAMYLLNP